MAKSIISTLTLLSLLFSLDTQADIFESSLCLSGKRENSHLVQQFTQARKNSEITKTILKKYNLTIDLPDSEAQATEICWDCLKDKKGHVTRNNEDLKAIMRPMQAFKNQCLKAVARIQTGSAELLCPQGTSTKASQCINLPMLQYQSSVLTEFYNCVQAVNPSPLEKSSLFEMYSLESAFKPSFSNPGGTGLGQLTSIFIKDIHQKHRGKPILTAISKSNNESCQLAKKITQKDSLSQPSFKKRCDFVQYGEGMERNILYSLIGLANSWNKDIGPAMKDYSNKFKDHPSLSQAQQKALINAYGAGGLAAARAAVKRLTRLTPDKFAEAMEKPMPTLRGRSLTKYTTDMKKRQLQLTASMEEPLKSEFIKKGAQTCVY